MKNICCWVRLDHYELYWVLGTVNTVDCIEMLIAVSWLPAQETAFGVNSKLKSGVPKIVP